MLHYKNFSLLDINYVDESVASCIEKWLPVVGFEGYYEVSDLGRVRGVLRRVSNNKIVYPKILKQRVNNRGYLVTSLRKNGQLLIPFIHKLVISAFLQNKEGNRKATINLV